ncbi:MAG: CBS domain-containing protein [Planctomycetaceae bacterium]|nr:CBS domain-containing protein [Planctomycetaceae bacterium]
MQQYSVKFNKRISGVPVVDDDSYLLGMLTEFDLLRAIRNHRLDARADEFMSADVITADKSDSLANLTDLILEKRVRRVPILEQGRLVGIVSRRDLVFVGHIRQQLLSELPVASVSLDFPSNE